MRLQTSTGRSRVRRSGVRPPEAPNALASPETSRDAQFRPTTRRPGACHTRPASCAGAGPTTVVFAAAPRLTSPLHPCLGQRLAFGLLSEIVGLLPAIVDAPSFVESAG